MVAQWCKYMEEVKMKANKWSIEEFMEYVEEFKVQRLLAGETVAPPEEEIVKIFVKGLRPDELQTEIRRRGLKTMEGVVNTTNDVILQFKAMYDLHVPRKEERKEKADKPKRPESAKVDKPEATATVTCYKCLQSGHYASSCTNPRHPDSKWKEKKREAKAVIKRDAEAVVRSVRMFSSDLPSQADEFIRIETILLLPADELKTDRGWGVTMFF